MVLLWDRNFNCLSQKIQQWNELQRAQGLFSYILINKTPYFEIQTEMNEPFRWSTGLCSFEPQRTNSVNNFPRRSCNFDFHISSRHAAGKKQGVLKLTQCCSNSNIHRKTLLAFLFTIDTHYSYLHVIHCGVLKVYVWKAVLWKEHLSWNCCVSDLLSPWLGPVSRLEKIDPESFWMLLLLSKIR